MSTPKPAGYFDLAAAGWLEDMGQAKSLLREVMAMLVGLKGYLKGGLRGRGEGAKEKDEEER